MNSVKETRKSQNPASETFNQSFHSQYKRVLQQQSAKQARGFTGRRLVECYVQPIPFRQGSWVTYNSPLWKKDRIQTDEELKDRFLTRSKCFPTFEAGFLNDAVRTSVYSTRRTPVIPEYSALMDKYSQAYFMSPLVQSILERNKSCSLKRNTSAINKLSTRRRCIPTPDNFKLWQRENGFVNDAIITEKMRTKYKDIIPLYDARRDQCCQLYFERQDIKRLISRTCPPRVTLPAKSKSAVS